MPRWSASGPCTPTSTLGPTGTQTSTRHGSTARCCLPGNSFYWKTHGMDITSTIREVVPGQRLVWGGPAGGIDGVHVWTFEQTGSQVTVRTEESWSGAPVDAAPQQLGQALEQSLTTWFAGMKTRTERTD
ncbi:SRPBCC domain-containing protein [Streptomyces misionensis]|uniref:SRPBCC domain-containing protein n=1 Tax=Streptomyces misionensis TaxID=67331 RepID=UPI00368DE4AE